MIFVALGVADVYCSISSYLLLIKDVVKGTANSKILNIKDYLLHLIIPNKSCVSNKSDTEVFSAILNFRHGSKKCTLRYCIL